MADNKENKDRTELAKGLQDAIQELKEKTEIENIVRNNIIEFDYKEKKFRVRKPTLADRQKANKKIAEKQIELLKSDKHVLRGELIKLYKAKGIDIDKIDVKISELQKSHDELLLKLAKLDKKDDVEKIEQEILKIRSEQTRLSLEKSSLLSSSIESQLDEFLKSYLLFLSFEVKENDEWKQAFEKYQYMMETTEDKLILQAAYYLSLLIFSDEI